MSTVTNPRTRPGRRSGVRALLWQLSAAHTDSDRRRFRQIVLAVAGCAMFLIAAIAIVTAPDVVGRDYGADGQSFTSVTFTDVEPLAPFVGDPELRGGTTLGAVLLAVPFVLFGVQALRTGTAARERRLAALSLAGATRRQLRRLASLEGTRAAVIGALLAGPGYLLLWLVFGRLLPAGAKMLPEPGVAVIISWPVLVVLLTLAGAGAGALAARPATVSPLGIVRGQPDRPGKATVVLIFVAIVVLIVGLAALARVLQETLIISAMAAAVILLAVSGGPWLILFVARMAVRGDLITMLAGRRLLADVRSPGRVAGVLFTVGIVVGVVTETALDLITRSNDELAFYLGGLGAAGLGAMLAALVATGSLIVGVTEQVLQGRRATAVLVALAASTDFVCQVVRRQLILVAVPATLFGVVLGWLFIALLSGSLLRPMVLLGLPVALVVSGYAAAAGALVTARAVRPVIRESSTPDNLRVA
ncbi:MAG TPA: hypothetical protein VLL08_30555 [Kineosporiaceae bacterium]|nr:hypothetical protein [Kineosporiaceae bacterium]